MKTPISCLDIFILSADQQGGTLENAVRDFAAWKPLQQRSFLSVLKQCIQQDPGLLWMRGKYVSDPDTYHEFLMRAGNLFRTPSPSI